MAKDKEEKKARRRKDASLPPANDPAQLDPSEVRKSFSYRNNVAEGFFLPCVNFYLI